MMSSTQAIFAAYIIWGFSPLYWKALDGIPSLTIVSARILGSVFFLIILSALTGRLQTFSQELRNKKAFSYSAITAALLAINWLLYVAAIAANRTVEASLGYFILPLMSIVAGRFFFSERINTYQSIAVLFAIVGVLTSTVDYGTIPWYGLGLALSFTIYGTIHKILGRDPIVALTLESAILSPFALFYMIQNSQILEVVTSTQILLLIGAGIITALPMYFYCNGLKGISFTALGFIAYLNPTLSLLIALFIFEEPFSTVQFIAFLFVWTGILIFLLNRFGTIQNTRLRAAK